MRYFLVVLIYVWPLWMQGQYTYFNNGYPPPYPQVGSGTADNLLLQNNNFLTFGIYPSNGEIISGHYLVDGYGELINLYEYPFENNGIASNEFADAIIAYQDGFLGARAYWDNSVEKYYGRISTYNSLLQEQIHYDLLQYQADSILYSDYSCAKLLNDGNFIATGNVTIDTIPDQNNWPTNDNILLTKVSSDGSLIWHKDFAFYNLEYFTLPQRFAKTNELSILPTGELLVWGAWYDQADPFVIKFDSLGNFIQELHWGHNTLSDWLAWPVQISDHEFMFAYTNAIGLFQNFLVVGNIKIGILDANDMTIDWVGTYDYQHDAGGVADFEKTPDGGYVVLGYGGDASIEGFIGEAFMLKIDAYGNEEWYRTYQPPAAPFFSPQTYDLEVAADGSLIFLGNYEDADAGYYATWLVKTDPCGDEVFNGCPVGVIENSATKTKSDLLEVYPNPANNFITVNYHQEMKGLVIRNVLGEVVSVSSLHNHALQYQIDVSTLHPGIYLIEADLGQGKIAAARMIKE